MDSDAAELQRLQGNLIRLGTVAEVDLATARCRVRSGEVLTDLLPWWVPRAGDTIEWSSPTVGEQGLLLCAGGETNGGLFLRGIYSTAFAAPSSSADKHLVRFVDGAVMEYDTAAHALKSTLPAGGTFEVTAD